MGPPRHSHTSLRRRHVVPREQHHTTRTGRRSRLIVARPAGVPLFPTRPRRRSQRDTPTSFEVAGPADPPTPPCGRVPDVDRAVSKPLADDELPPRPSARPPRPPAVPRVGARKRSSAEVLPLSPLYAIIRWRCHAGSIGRWRPRKADPPSETAPKRPERRLARREVRNREHQDQERKACGGAEELRGFIGPLSFALWPRVRPRHVEAAAADPSSLCASAAPDSSMMERFQAMQALASVRGKRSVRSREASEAKP